VYSRGFFERIVFKGRLRYLAYDQDKHSRLDVTPEPT
jgi:hypothetical protein